MKELHWRETMILKKSFGMAVVRLLLHKADNGRRGRWCSKQLARAEVVGSKLFQILELALPEVPGARATSNASERHWGCVPASASPQLQRHQTTMIPPLTAIRVPTWSFKLHLVHSRERMT